ncbi:hypothetical protein BN7_3027 [Wickerhamomyces ciferrii]|uniref:RIC1 C-terminal alpha solenoid region domain-containing protein n=1 Tax=Wickerhamomyces ciferrii (strain ATCC 14091 / BCRC 22168 / CBS 111 / JCM 3599 / NBRC 0793 / NRRL Y-1031 F-60-10) TaxID=1206466 RepID=K0KMP3_WICCF|nr:uncharacterized protein BN7_3027 [Wickerhamomyces ciferrii]CCH43477.1 hypothetical protein BN7_3027 [Wickerhamomyces ciferrii]
MAWPYSTPKVAQLPGGSAGAQGGDGGAQGDAGDAGIIQISSANNKGQPYAILTKNSILLYDEATDSVISTHDRSHDSLEKYGVNLSMKRNYDDSLIIIQTDQNYLLIYIILKPQDDEILSVYHGHNGKLLQNGNVIETKSQFFSNTEILEEPIKKYQIRFKLFLKISNGIIDYQPLNKLNLLLVTQINTQLINLENNDNQPLDLGLSPDNHVKKIIHSCYKPHLFAFKLNNGNILFHNRTGYLKFDKFTEPSYFQGCQNGSINPRYKILVFIFDYNKLIYYNYDIQQKIKEKDLSSFSSSPITKITWDGKGESLIVLFQNGNWLITSTFGSIIFNSLEYDIPKSWLTSIKTLDIVSRGDKLILSDGNTIFPLELIKQLYLSKQTNHNLKRPVLIQGSNVHIYTGYEMNPTSLNKPFDWNIIKIPMDIHIQIPQITYSSISIDGKYLALTNEKSLLIYSFHGMEWSFYINDYNSELKIDQLNWFEKFNLLIVTNKTSINSELIILNFRKFKHEETFNSNLIIFKYDFDSNIKLINSLDDDILVFTEDNKFYQFKILPNGISFKIDLIKILSINKNFNEDDNNFHNIIKINSKDPENNDLLVLNNGELLYLNYKTDRYEKNLLLDKIEYIYKINDEEYYLFNGDSIFLIKKLSNLLTTRDPTSSILKISIDDESNHPFLLILEKGLIISLKNSIIKKPNLEINQLITKNSIFLHDLIRFEITTQSPIEIFHKYQKYKNFQYSLELLLYQSIINSLDIEKLIKLIKINPSWELNIISKCLRKIDLKYWDLLFQNFQKTPQVLLDQCIELKQYKTLGNLIIIFLNYTKEETIDDDGILKILKIIFKEADNDDELYKIGVELIGFLKKLDPSGELLKKSLKELKEDVKTGV